MQHQPDRLASTQHHWQAKWTAEQAVFYGCQCKSWKCEACGPRRRAKRTAQMMAGRPTRFVTCTYRANQGGTLDEKIARIVKAWAKYVRLFRSKPRHNKLEYAYTIELNGNGDPHLHILTRGDWINAAELAAHMRAEIDSPIVKVLAIKSAAGAIRYVTKYCTKAPIRCRGRKTASQSHGYALQRWTPPPREWMRDQPWHNVGGGKARAIELARILGFDHIIDKGTAVYASRAPPPAAAIAEAA